MKPARAPCPDAIRLARMVLRCFEALPKFGIREIALREDCGLHLEAKKIWNQHKKEEPQMPHYIVETKLDDNITRPARLIKTTLKARAERHVSQSCIFARVATTDEVVAHLHAGGEIEDLTATKEESVL